MTVDRDMLGALIQKNKEREQLLGLHGRGFTEIGILSLNVRALRRYVTQGDMEKDLEFQLCYQEELAEALDEIERAIRLSILQGGNGNGG